MKYIADLHLYDVYSLGWRPNVTLEEFANHLMYTWNMSTEEDDLVFIVGDIGYCCDRTKDLIRKLHGKKVLVLGNHDIAWGNEIYDNTLFQGVYREVRQGRLYVSHVPQEQYDCDYFIHGHHHRYDLPGMQNKLRLYQQNSKLLNCSVDLLKSKPMTLPELITNKEMVIEDYISRHIL